MNKIVLGAFLFSLPAMAQVPCLKSSVTAAQMAELKQGKIVMNVGANPVLGDYSVTGLILAENTQPKDVAAILFDYENYADPFNTESISLKDGYVGTDNPKEVVIRPVEGHPLNQQGELYVPFAQAIGVKKQGSRFVWTTDTTSSPRIVTDMRTENCIEHLGDRSTFITVNAHFVGNPQIPFEILPMPKRLEIWYYALEAIRLKTHQKTASSAQLNTLKAALGN
jgi:hypothetical protein